MFAPPPRVAIDAPRAQTSRWACRINRGVFAVICGRFQAMAGPWLCRCVVFAVRHLPPAAATLFVASCLIAMSRRLNFQPVSLVETSKSDILIIFSFGACAYPCFRLSF